MARKLSGSTDHERFMKRALTLARRGMGRVSPNPLVGAVVVKNGRTVGEGYHLYDRRDHAEIVALRRSGRQARGATLYLNLEPCVHQGRTAPCVEQIVKAGVREVFVAIRDPDPRVKGRGIRRLRKRGLTVHVGLCRQEAERFNEKFLCFVQTSRPFVVLKLALTLDGRIAARGHFQWITGPRARAEAHRLRYEYDAILVGRGTIVEDNPSLNVRWRRRNAITKVILDSKLRISEKAKLFRSADPAIIFHDYRVPKARIKTLSKKARLIAVHKQDGLLAWDEVLDHLGHLNLTSLILEGGSQVATSALRAGVVRKIHFFYGPKIIGSGGQPGIEDLLIDRLEQALKLSTLRVRRLPPDFMVEAYLESAG